MKLIALLLVLSCDSSAAAFDAKASSDVISKLLNHRAHSIKKAVKKGQEMEHAMEKKTTTPVTIDSQFITIDNALYSRYGATSAVIGGFGTLLQGKADPSKVTWTDEGPAAWTNNNVKFGSTVTLTPSQASSLNVDLSASVASVVNASSGINSNSTGSSSYALQEVTLINTYPVLTWFRQQANCDPSVTDPSAEDYCTEIWLNGLAPFLNPTAVKQAGLPPNPVRIATTIWILAPSNANTAAVLNKCSGGNFSLGTTNAGLSLTNSNCADITFSFSTNSTMAWLGSQIIWQMANGEIVTPYNPQLLSPDTYHE